MAAVRVTQWQPQERGVQAQELAALDELDEPELADDVPFGLLNVENWSCLRPLPHFGHSMRSELERTSRS